MQSAGVDEAARLTVSVSDTDAVIVTGVSSLHAQAGRPTDQPLDLYSNRLG